VSGVDVEPEIRGEGTPEGEISRQYLDSTAIREELGWEPRWELEDGLRAAWQWYERHLAST
jgi:CDP-glucose 4,6-dehydratase